MDARPTLNTALVAQPTSSFYPAMDVDAVDPSLLGFPPMLAFEVAMQTAPIDQIFEGYGLTITDYQRLMASPDFLTAVATAKQQLKDEGMSFKIKAKLQAEELMKQSWKMIHDPLTPHSVRADLIKSTVRWAGYEPKAGAGSVGDGITALQINIDLGDKK